MRGPVVPGLLALALVAACGEEVVPREVAEAPDQVAHSTGPAAGRAPVTIEKPGGLRIEVLAEGEGPRVRSGDRVSLHYVARIEGAEEPLGSSRESGVPLTVELRRGRVIPGLLRGLEGRRVGTRCVLTIPSALAYGEEGLERAHVPPGATLVYEVEILDARSSRDE